ncbi:hypothetical protein CC79DRAFT_1376787 [Sarocladium strictum]
MTTTAGEIKGANEESVHVIQADLLIPGRGEPLSDAAIVYNTKTILYVGPQADIPECYNALDATHLPVNPIVSGARSVRDLELLLNAGYTSVRECGGNGIFLDQVVEDGYFIGPKIYSQGLQVWLCDGVDECTKAVRLQTRKGAKFIKICASGGVLSQKDDPKHQQYSAQELQAFVAEAALSERIVAAHCHGKAGIMAALRAGARTIEHGTYLDLECVALMKEKEAILVPTRTLHEVLRTGLSATSAKKMIDASKNLKFARQLAIKHGVKIALGSDLGLGIQGHPAAHCQNALELSLAVDAGMTSLAAIEAATASGPLTLGPQAPLFGQIAVGYEPDFIAVTSSPLDDISVLVNPDNITHVWRRRMLYKSPDSTKV